MLDCNPNGSQLFKDSATDCQCIPLLGLKKKKHFQGVQRLNVLGSKLVKPQNVSTAFAYHRQEQYVFKVHSGLPTYVSQRC